MNGKPVRIILGNLFRRQNSSIMRNITRGLALILFIGGLTYQLAAQTAVATRPRMQFIGLFVNNLDSTIGWYKDKLGFAVLKQEASPDNKFRFAMLEWNGYWIEMIQNPGVASRKSVAESQPAVAGVEGFFKPGFYVDDIVYWEKYFKDRKVKFKYEMMTNEKFNMKLFIVEDPEGNLIQFYTFL
jgi:catechol 2,3-dioxygenase-like lactoylglutathione lyase family enzyme